MARSPTYGTLFLYTFIIFYHGQMIIRVQDRNQWPRNEIFLKMCFSCEQNYYLQFLINLELWHLLSLGSVGAVCMGSTVGKILAAEHRRTR